MKLDIHTTVQVAFLLAVLGAISGILLGIKSIRDGMKLLYFQKRRGMVARGWRMFFTAGIFIFAAYILFSFAEPTVYLVFPPSSTITLSPTITSTLAPSLTPSITQTASITPTPEISYTPHIPTDIIAKFTSVVTPNTEAVFSPISFSQKIDERTKQAIRPKSEFIHPIGTLYATYSYDKMVEGSQWTALWYRFDGIILCTETIPWNGSTGGYGYTLCNPPAAEWLPGEYEVQIFIGTTWTVSGKFTITGDPPTPTNTSTVTKTPTYTSTATFTPTPTLTATPTYTRTHTLTPIPTLTFTAKPTSTITPTNKSTATRKPTLTTIPSSTLKSTPFPQPTDTRWPSITP